MIHSRLTASKDWISDHAQLTIGVLGLSVFVGLLLAGLFWYTTRITVELPKSTYLATDSVEAFVGNAQPEKIQTEVVNMAGQDIGVSVEKTAKDGGTAVVVSKPLAFKPGKYTFKVIDALGKEHTQDFSWGVLAINSNKAAYAPGETAELSLAVLDETGMMVCDAKVELNIRIPNGQTRKLSTEGKEISVNPECVSKDYTEKPDYQASYTTEGEGRYELTLKAETKNGTFEITDGFEVKLAGSDPFIIERSSATRIYPIHKYPVIMKVTARQDYEGDVTETVPYAFETSPSDKGQAYTHESFDTSKTVFYQTRTLHWDVKLKKGDSITLAYQYDAPDESPYFFLVGPLTFASNDGHPGDESGESIGSKTIYTEHRTWQIAVDAVATALEQQINLTDQEYSSTSQSSVPTDNSLGLSKWDGSKYNNESVYLDATIKKSESISGGDLGEYNSMYCVTATDCKIVYFDGTRGDLRFKDCDDATCSTGTVSIIDGQPNCTLTGGDGCTSTNLPGWYASIDCSAGTADCKVAYYAFGTGDLFFADCDNATCSSGSVEQLDGGTGCSLTGGDVCDTGLTVGDFNSIDCSAGASDCKIIYRYQSASDLYFADCGDATCSTGSTELLDGGTSCALSGGDACSSSAGAIDYTSLDCSAGAGDCKMTYTRGGDLWFGDCSNAACSAGTAEILDGDVNCALTTGDACDTTFTDVGEHSSLDCSAGASDCKIAYEDEGNDDLYFADCGDATCSTGSTELLDGGTLCALSSGDACSDTSATGDYVSLDCTSGSTDCKMTYQDASTSDLFFGDCDDATCSTGSVEDLDGVTGCGLSTCSSSNVTGQYTNIDCVGGASDCKISYYNSTVGSLSFADCSSATCSSGSTSVIDGTGAGGGIVGVSSSLYCVSSSDCKVAYYDTEHTSLRFLDCDDATCSTGTINILDGDTGCVLASGSACSTSSFAGSISSIDCSAGGNDCKIAYYYSSTGDLYFADCDDATCSSGTRRILDGGTGCVLSSGDGCSTSQAVSNSISLDCSAGGSDCKIAYQRNDDLYFADCADATCSSGAIEMLDGNTGCALTGGDQCDVTSDTGEEVSLDCSTGATDCKIAYEDETLDDIWLADCDDASCTTGSVELLDGNTGCSLSSGDACDAASDPGDGGLSLDCTGGTSDCKVLYRDVTNNDLYFGDCGDATCSTGSTELLDGGSGCALTGGDNCSTGFSVSFSSLDCSSGASDCKIVYRRSNYLYFGDCSNATCSAGSTELLDENSGCSLTGGDGCSNNTANVIGSTSNFNLDCSPGATDCKVAYQQVANTKGGFLKFGNCDDATCASGSTNIVDNGEEIVWVELYDSAGAKVPDGSVMYQPSISTTGYNYTRIRSGNALTLSDATNYSVRVKTSNASYTTGYVAEAKIVAAQAAGGGITDTETSIELGNNETSTGTSYAILAAPKIYYYDSDNFSGTPTMYFEASMKGSAGGVTASATLSLDATCATSVSSSAVTVTGTTWTLSRSSAITPQSDHDYFVCFKTSSGTASIANAKLIIDLTGSLDKIQTIQQLLHTSYTDADAAYTSQNPLNLLTMANFAGNDIHYYYEAVMKTSSATGYTQMYNATDSSAVTGSELSTTSTTFERTYTSDLDASLTTAKNYVSQIKGGASNTTTISNAWMIIQIGTPEAERDPSPIPEQTIKGGTQFKGGSQL